MNKFLKYTLWTPLVALLMAGVTEINNLNHISWSTTKHVETVGKITITSAELDGDNIQLYRGQPAMLTELFIKCNANGVAYTIESTDTIKVISTLDGVSADIAYLSDSIFTTINSTVAYSPIGTGLVDGTTYTLEIPTGKVDNGTISYDIFYKLFILK